MNPARRYGNVDGESRIEWERDSPEWGWLRARSIVSGSRGRGVPIQEAMPTATRYAYAVLGDDVEGDRPGMFPRRVWFALPGDADRDPGMVATAVDTSAIAPGDPGRRP